jgi:hypothetical protein
MSLHCSQISKDLQGRLWHSWAGLKENETAEIEPGRPSTLTS